MMFNPLLHHRRSIRLKEYDYSQPGVYFVNICIRNYECLLGNINVHDIELNDFGEIVKYSWENIPKYFNRVDLDKYIMMPNHLHGIIIINGNNPKCVGAKHFY